MPFEKGDRHPSLSATFLLLAFVHEPCADNLLYKLTRDNEFLLTAAILENQEVYTVSEQIQLKSHSSSICCPISLLLL